MTSGYDVGMVCLRGHAINEMSRKYPDSNQAFCPDCGAATIDACPKCSGEIRGRHRDSMSSAAWRPPAFCDQCGAPLPWTEKAKSSADDLIDMLDGLDESERAALKGTLDHLMSDSAQTEVAAMKFKVLARKAGGEGATALRAIVTSVATEAAKRLILG